MTGAAQLKIEYGPAEYGAERAEFAAAAFEPKDGHRGRLIIERRKAGGADFETVAICYIDELPAVLSALETAPGYDYYIPANTFSGCRRTREQLFAFNNIVIDIDAHDMKDRAARCALLEKFVAGLLRDLRPLPGFIVFTGRGVQLWYPIEQESYKAARRYIVVREDLIKQVEEIRRRQEFAALTLDAGASRNMVSPYRLPFTENTKTAGETPDGAPIRGRVQWIHDKRLRLSHEEKRIAAAAGRSKEDIERGVFKMPGRRHIVATEQAAQLIALPGIRSAAGISLTGVRHFYFYLLTASLLRAGWSRDRIEAEARRINDTLDDPLKDSELKSCFRGCYRRYDRDGRGYPAHAKEIISKLQITEEEALQLALFADPRTKREKEKAKRRKKKAARNDQILELYRQGKTQTEIAAAVGCSIATAGRVIKGAGNISAAEQLRANICRLYQQGHKAAEIADICGVSLGTVYYHIREARKAGENLATEPENVPAGVFIDTETENATEAPAAPQAAAINEEGPQAPAELPAFVRVSAAREAGQLPGSGAHEEGRPAEKSLFQSFSKTAAYTRRGNAPQGPAPCINIHSMSLQELKEWTDRRRPVLTDPADIAQKRRLEKLIARHRAERARWGSDPPL